MTSTNNSENKSNASQVQAAQSTRSKPDDQTTTRPSLRSGSSLNRVHSEFGSRSLPDSTARSHGINPRLTKAGDDEAKQRTQNRLTRPEVTEYNPTDYLRNASKFVEDAVEAARGDFEDFTAQRAANHQKKD
jgi:hypothetical protein